MQIESTPLAGSCHCGSVSLHFHTTKTPEGFRPRACDCSFCQKHGAMYLSDASGRLVLKVEDAPLLQRYRQGAGVAEFLSCARCGVLVAVIHESGGKTIGAINARCMDALGSFGEPIVVSPQKLGPNEKIERWSEVWIQEVRIDVAPLSSG